MENQPPATPTPAQEPKFVPSTPPRLARRFDRTPSSSNRNLIIYGLVAVLVIAGLLLPPISLAERLFPPCGEWAIKADSPSVQHPDGLIVQQASADQSYRLTVTAVKPTDFASGAAGETLAGARDSLPVNLAIESPVFKLAVCGDKPQPATISLTVPPSVEPQNTLDIYGWNAATKTWSWLGSGESAASGSISAAVDALPSAVALVQTTSTAPAIGVMVGSGESLSTDLAGIVTEVYPTGLVILADGTLGGDRPSLPGTLTNRTIYPIIRNYLAHGRPNPDLVRDVLSVADARKAHLDALVALAVDGDYAGVTLDYQSLTAADRDAYASFISDLAAALRAKNKRLNVVLPQPAFLPTGEADAAGYDWSRIGLAVDALLSPMDDAALIAWVTSQVNRYKFQPILVAGSTDTVKGVTTPISFKQAIEPLGVVSTTGSLNVTAQSVVTLTLQSDVAVSHFAFDPVAKVYRYEYTDKSGVAHAVTVGTAAVMADGVAAALPHYVRGVVIGGLAGDAAPAAVDVLRAYRQQSVAQVAPQINITWQVQSGGKEVSKMDKALTESWLGWPAPADAGVYRVSASIAGVERGALEVVVSASAPVTSTAAASDTVAEGDVRSVTAGVGSSGNITLTTSGGAPAADCFNAAYVADVTVPDGTRFDNNKDFTKTWKVHNNGTCAWNADTELAFVQGSQLGAASTVTVGPLDAGKDVEISVPMKTSDQNGSLTGVWQLRNKDGFYGQTLTVVISAGPEQAAGAGPVAPIGNIGSFELGGQVDSFRRADLMKRAGMNWVKLQAFAGGDMRGTIGNFHNAGFKVLLSVKGDIGSVMDGGYQDQYAASVAAMAAAGADAIEVWNEPNIDREWPNGQVNGASYTALLAKAYRAIKAANPGTLVISAAPAPTGFFAGGCQASGCNDDVFLAQMAAAGAANYMDCVGAHHNAGATSPSATSGHPAAAAFHYSWYFRPTLDLYYNSFGGARKVCFTELGYLSGEGYPSLQSTAPAFAWASNTTVAQQAAWLAEAVSLSVSTGKVRLAIVFNVDFTYYGSDPQAGYAIIRPGDACPACEALHAVLGGR